MKDAIAVHTYTDLHGTVVKEPVLVRIRELPSYVCDMELMEQLAEYNGAVGIVRDGHLGDLLMLTPTIRELKLQLPGLELHVFCEPRFLRVFKGNPYVASSMEMSQQNIKTVVYSIDLRGYVERVEAAHEIDRTTLFGKAFDIEVSDGKTDFMVEEEDRSQAIDRVNTLQHIHEHGRFVVLGPDASDGRRRLSDEFVSRFEQLMFDAGYSVFVTGTERGELPELGELGAILEMADAIVSADNGVYHLAAAVDAAPIFPIFTTIRPELRCCWYNDCHPIVADIECAPCSEQSIVGCRNQCIAAIDAEAVVRQVLGAL